MFNLDDCFALIACNSGKIFSEALDKALIPYNVTRAQWIAMYYIANNDCISQKGLADKMSIKEPTVVRMLQKMGYEDFVFITNCHKDKRKKYLKLTEKGTKIYYDLMPIVEKFKNDTIAGIKDEDLQMLKIVLDKMVKNALKL